MYNLVILLGRITETPEQRISKDKETVYCKFTFATNYKSPFFIECIAFGKTAEIICKYFKKGDAMFLQGNLFASHYTNKDNQRRTFTKVNVTAVSYVATKRELKRIEEGGEREDEQDNIAFSDEFIKNEINSDVDYRPEKGFEPKGENDILDNFKPVIDDEEDLPF